MAGTAWTNGTVAAKPSKTARIGARKDSSPRDVSRPALAEWRSEGPKMEAGNKQNGPRAKVGAGAENKQKTSEEGKRFARTVPDWLCGYGAAGFQGQCRLIVQTGQALPSS